MPRRNKNNEYTFNDYPNFNPNLSPREMFVAGSFGGTYWRPIYSSVNKKNYKNQHLNYPKSWWKGLPDNYLITPWDKYDKTINTYNVMVGTTLEFWECKEWIKDLHPYGWVQWYCNFFQGKRSPDDERQVKRWMQTAGPKSRFRKRLINMINNKNAEYDDFTISPKIRQTLQHWGYRLTKEDIKNK